MPENGFRTDRVPVNKVFDSEALTCPFSDLTQRPTNKLFRREMIEREGLLFSETKVANDVKFVLQSIVSSARIVAIAESLIEVRMFENPHSISSNRAQHIDDIFDVFRDFRDWLCERGLYERYASSYVDAWAVAFHSNSSYGGTACFFEAAARVLGAEEPWRSMSDKELFDAARLDTSVFVVSRAILRCPLGKGKSEYTLQRIDNRLLAVREVVHLLNSEYGKHLPEHSNLVKSALAYLRRNGLRYYVKRLLMK